MRGGSIQAQQLAEFYKSPEVPKEGPSSLLSKTGLRFTHMPHLNKYHRVGSRRAAAAGDLASAPA